MYGDGYYDVISGQLSSLEQGHFNQTMITLAELKVQVFRSACNELAETGVILQPLRGHHFVVQHRVWGRAATHLRRLREAMVVSTVCDVNERVSLEEGAVLLSCSC